jgi:hypothetical protein
MMRMGERSKASACMEDASTNHLCDLCDLCAMLSPFAPTSRPSAAVLSIEFWPPTPIPLRDLRDLRAMLSPLRLVLAWKPRCYREILATNPNPPP